MVILVGGFSECIRIETEAAYEDGASRRGGSQLGDFIADKRELPDAFVVAIQAQ